MLFSTSNAPPVVGPGPNAKDLHPPCFQPSSLLERPVLKPLPSSSKTETRVGESSACMCMDPSAFLGVPGFRRMGPIRMRQGLIAAEEARERLARHFVVCVSQVEDGIICQADEAEADPPLLREAILQGVLLWRGEPQEVDAPPRTSSSASRLAASPGHLSGATPSRNNLVGLSRLPPVLQSTALSCSCLLMSRLVCPRGPWSKAVSTQRCGIDGVV